ncbi:terpene synthase family protein [Streptomyces niger]|uniref:terpene synthase family protein n=1 Tax=Streptomyces niger TaxID=66373 RepID=UPI00069B771E|nr:terpene synthase family protein [Streptomyces niger]
MNPETDSPHELTAYAYHHLTRLLPPSSTPHPAAEKVEEEVRRWAMRTGLYGPGQESCLARRKIGHLVGSCMPDAPTPVVRLTAHYLAWVFAFDDTVAEDAHRWSDTLARDLPHLLEHGTPTSNAPNERKATSGPNAPNEANEANAFNEPNASNESNATSEPNVPNEPNAQESDLIAALADIRQDIVTAGGEPLLTQLAAGLRQYLDSCTRETPWRATRMPPALGDYLCDRTHTSGGHPLYLHRLAPGMPPLTEALPPAVIGLAELAFLIGGLANDLLGFAAEQQHDDPVNAVTVLAHEYRLPTPDAYRATVILHATLTHRFTTDHARLLTDPGLSEPQRRFVVAIGGWVAGSAAATTPYWHHLQTQQPRAHRRPP